MISIATLLTLMGIAIPVLGGLIYNLTKLGKLETRIQIYKECGDEVKISVESFRTEMKEEFKELRKEIHKTSKI